MLASPSLPLKLKMIKRLEILKESKLPVKPIANGQVELPNILGFGFQWQHDEPHATQVQCNTLA